MEVNKVTLSQTLATHGLALGTTEELHSRPVHSQLAFQILSVCWKQDTSSDPRGHTFESCISESTPWGTALSTALGSPAAEEINDQL